MLFGLTRVKINAHVGTGPKHVAVSPSPSVPMMTTCSADPNPFAELEQIGRHRGAEYIRYDWRIATSTRRWRVREYCTPYLSIGELLSSHQLGVHIRPWSSVLFSILSRHQNVSCTEWCRSCTGIEHQLCS